MPARASVNVPKHLRRIFEMMLADRTDLAPDQRIEVLDIADIGDDFLYALEAHGLETLSDAEFKTAADNVILGMGYAYTYYGTEPRKLSTAKYDRVAKVLKSVF